MNPAVEGGSATESEPREDPIKRDGYGTDDIFPETNWSMVSSAGGSSSATVAALEELCVRYRLPVVRLVPRYGFPVDDAEDLAHEYFASLLKRGYLAQANRDFGRFRAFIIHDLKLFLSNARRKRNAQKRGGSATDLSLDQLKEDSGFDPSGPDADSVDVYFDRQWALETARQARAQLAESYGKRGEGRTFEILSQGLSEEAGIDDYTRWGEELGKDPGTVKVAMHRLRERFRKAIEERVRETVTSEEDLRIEMAHLRESLR